MLQLVTSEGLIDYDYVFRSKFEPRIFEKTFVTVGYPTGHPKKNFWLRQNKFHIDKGLNFSAGVFIEALMATQNEKNIFIVSAER